MTNSEYKKKIIEILKCLIKANKEHKIVDTLWLNDYCTLFEHLIIEADLTEKEYKQLESED